MGNSKGLIITNTSNASLKTDYGKLKLNNMLVVPKLKKQLSTGQLITDAKCTVEFNFHGFVVKNQEKYVLAKGHKRGNLYALDESKEVTFSAIGEEAANLDVLHVGKFFKINGV